MREPLRATEAQRRHLATDIAPRETQIDDMRRAGMLRSMLLDVAVVGKDAVRVLQKVKNTERRQRRTAAQVKQSAIATLRAKQAAQSKRTALGISLLSEMALET